MIITPKDKSHHDSNDICCICKNEFENGVRDHCHATGNHSVPARSISNLRYKQENVILVVIHKAVLMT